MKRILFCVAIIIISATVSADIYKCVSDDGVVTYSDEPCGPKSSVFGKTMSLNKLIASVCPYDQPVFNPDDLSNDLLEFSQKLGSYIVPDKIFNSSSVFSKEDPLSLNWNIHLSYDCGRKFNESGCISITLLYERKKLKKQKPLSLKSIVIKQWGNPYDPPAMMNVKKMRKTDIGIWITDER